MSCSEWRIISFEESGLEIEDGDRGKNYPKKSELLPTGYCPFLNNKNVINDKITLDDVEFITKEKDEILRKGKIKVNDIVLTTRGSVGNVGLFHSGLRYKHARINSGMVIIRNNNDIFNLKYLYQLKSPLMKNQYKSMSTGTAQPQLPIKDIKKLELIVPPLEEQEKIANILSSLDDKIELNNDMNKTLEEMAQSIFKRWFVDFEFPNEDGEPYKSSGGEMVDSELGMIPKGWEVKTIDNLCEVGSSKRIFMKEYVDSGVPFYRGKEIIEKSKGNSISTELFITKERFEEIKEKFGVPNKNDILLTSVGTLGVAYLVDDEEFYFKDGNLTWFKNFKEEIYRYFIYQWIISSEGKKSIDAITIGSTQKALTINTLKGMKLVLPSNDILSLFEGFIKSNINNIRSNNEEKSNLIDIRNSLLTKLMSGEIDINL